MISTWISILDNTVILITIHVLVHFIIKELLKNKILNPEILGAFKPKDIKVMKASIQVRPMNPYNSINQ